MCYVRPRWTSNHLLRRVVPRIAAGRVQWAFQGFSSRNINSLVSIVSKSDGYQETYAYNSIGAPDTLTYPTSTAGGSGITLGIMWPSVFPIRRPQIEFLHRVLRVTHAPPRSHPEVSRNRSHRVPSGNFASRLEFVSFPSHIRLCR